MRTTICKRVKK